ncbi:MAG TPA: DUF4383 domain-containing protein, partial [Thermoanaerobaculia bacterium]
MTTVQRAAQIFGIVFLLVGIAGFFVTGLSMEADPEHAPRLLGLFPVNALHNVVHLLFGVWGLVASRTFEGSRTYGRVGGVVYLLLALLGFVSPDMFGLVPIGDHDIWLHAVLGIALAAVGFTARPAATAR